MIINHPIFGILTKDDYNEYRGTYNIHFTGVKQKVELTLEIFDDNDLEYFVEEGLYEKYNNEILFEEYSTIYQSFIKNLDKITPEILKNIREYQNECYYNSDHTASFKYFENDKDVIENIELLQIVLQCNPFGIVTETKLYQEMAKDEEDEIKCIVLVFYAEWVNDDYRLLSVAIVNEKVIYVTEESISD